MSALCQHFTPLWLAQALVERHFGSLGADDMVLEPCCGHGAFLNAIPASVKAWGAELDPAVAQLARTATKRPVMVGDVLGMDLAGEPWTAVIGNPPFRGRFIDKLLDRCHSWLPDGGRVGLILPAYFFRTAARVCQLSDNWHTQVELLPRSAFAYRMIEPILFAVLTKGRARVMVGLALFDEESDRQGMQQAYRRALAASTGSAWRAVCHLALTRLKATELAPARLAEIYRELEGHRPSRTTWWREKIRQTLRQYPDFKAIEEGLYALA